MDVLNELFATFKVSANVFHNGQYCGNWAVDTSGSQYMSFDIVSHGRCFVSMGDSAQTWTLEKGDIVLFSKDIIHCITSVPSFETQKKQSQSIDFQQGLAAGGTGLICGYFAHHHPMIGAITEHLPDAVVIQGQGNNPNKSGLYFLLEALLNESLQPQNNSDLIMGKIAEAILAMIFRQHLPTETGVLAVSPMEYITHWRLSKAYRMLADEKVTTLNAALTCGYDNESSFSKAFKRVLGVSPGLCARELRAQ